MDPPIYYNLPGDSIFTIKNNIFRSGGLNFNFDYILSLANISFGHSVLCKWQADCCGQAIPAQLFLCIYCTNCSYVYINVYYCTHF